MTLPPFLLALCVLFWGWQSGYGWLSGLLALALELARWPLLRRTISLGRLRVIANACVLLMVCMLAFFFASNNMTQTVLSCVRWLPLACLPLMLAILLSGLPQLPQAVMVSLARRGQAVQVAAGPQHDLGVPYAALWLLAAGVSNHPGPGFYLGLVVLCSGLLWGIRPRQRSPWVWAGLLLLVVVAGAGINWGLFRLQGELEQTMMDWIAGDGEEDPERTETALGHIGQLKLSGKVVMQVSAEQALATPMLLKTASYNLYIAPNWVATGGRAFKTVPRVASDQQAWQLLPAVQAGPVMTIQTSATRNNVVLALPGAASWLESGQFFRLEHNLLGTVQAVLEHGAYSYRLHLTGAGTTAGAPVAEDLSVPRHEQALMADLARSLKLSGLPPDQVLARVKAYFAREFHYTTLREGNTPGRSVMADFLQRDHAGHCEHFATATTLLLRAAGIPARYTVGYVLQEPDRIGHGYLVRARHAHAWVEAWVNGAWQTVDTTPASWSRVEQGQASLWEPVSDLFSWLLYRLRQWHFSSTEFLLLCLAVLVVIFVRGKLKQRGRAERAGAVRKAVSDHSGEHAGLDPGSRAFQALEQVLARRGLARAAHEPLGAWQQRIAATLPNDAAEALAQLVRQYYGCRFGPPAVAQRDSALLVAACDAWQARFM